MTSPRNNKILVKVYDDQKKYFYINNTEVQSANSYEKNYREKSPIIAEVVVGNDSLFSGDIIVCHHNTFYLPSPYHLYGEYFSIPFNKIVFAKLNQDGSLTPIGGNIFCDRVDIKTYLPLPTEQIKQYIDRVICTDPGTTDFKEGQLLFTRPYSYYEIVYVVDGVKHRIHKCDSQMVCGIVV